MKKELNNILKGIAAAPGIAIAQAYLFTKEKELIDDRIMDDPAKGVAAFKEAIEKSRNELKKIFGLAVDKLGEKRAAIFEAHLMILDDPILIENIIDRIKKEKKSPEYVVDDEISKYQKIMSDSHEPYMKERSQDIEDIKNRIIRNIKKKKWKSRITEDVIVVSENLTPADTVLFSRVNVKGYITNFGGLTSHTAIISRSLKIPAVVGIHDATNIINNGDLLIIDGFHGTVLVNPTDRQVLQFRSKIKSLSKFEEELKALRKKKAITLDGKEIRILANIDVVGEVELSLKNGAEGIGLVRTEQLFDESDQFPEENFQYRQYARLADKFHPNNIIIRAFDIGGDKVLPIDVKEPNPFLGWRGVRFLLDNPGLFKTQIRAVLRAAVDKNVSFMIPMIASIAEVRKSAELVNECKAELRKEKIKFNDKMKFGIMIEVPSAAVMTREFSSEVDFISIGTNDLIQYILAVDRGNEIVSKQYQEFHPAVIKTIKYIIDNAVCKKSCVSMCGEMAADPIALPLLIGMGLEAISVSAAVIPYSKNIIRSIRYEDAKILADECLICKTEKEISGKLHEFFDKHLLTASQETYSR